MKFKLALAFATLLLSVTTSSAQSTIYCPALTKQLKYGLTDSTTSGQVTELQKFLRSYYNLTDTNLRVSGIFGRVTETYVKQFQQQESLVVTGIVGAVSRAKIASKCPDEEITGTSTNLDDGPQTTQTYTLGTKDSKSTEFATNPATANLVHRVGLDSISTTIRDWIGHSAACSACYPGSTKTQTFSFSNLSPNSSEITLTIYTRATAGSANFTASISSGTGTISSGQTKSITSTTQADTWTIVVKPTSSSINLTVGNGLTTGTSYFYFDQIVAKVTTTSTNTTPTNQSCTFNNQTITHNSSVTAYQSASVTSPATCQSETRTCNNGTLSGSYTVGMCSVVQGATSSSIVTPTITYGTIDSAASGFAATVGSPAIVDVHSTADQSANIRAWIGYSSCPSCGTNNLTQRLKFANAAPNQRITVRVTPYFSSATQTFTASVSGATINSGSSQTFSAGNLSSSADWVVTFTTGATAGDVILTLANSYQSGGYYLYLDRIAVSSVSLQASSGPINLVDNSILVDGSLLPAYTTPNGLMAFKNTSNSVAAYNSSSTVVWQQTIPSISGVSGGLDANGDSFVDVIVARHNISPTVSCGNTTTDSSDVRVLSGKDGSLIYQSAAMANCTPYFGEGNPYSYTPYNAFHVGSILFGPTTDFYIARQYETQGWAARKTSSGGIETTGATYYPSSDAAATYYGSKLAATYTGKQFVYGAHAANGIISVISGQPILSIFTQPRLIQFTLAKTSTNLLDIYRDSVYYAHQSTADSYNDENASTCFDGCRQYGQVFSAKVGSTDYVGLIAGTNSSSLLTDTKANSKTYDKHAGIARQVRLVNNTTGAAIVQKYYSYSHDPSASDAHAYGGRITFVSRPSFEIEGTTYFAYNVYNQVDGRSDASVDDRWYISLNTISPSGTVTEQKIYNHYLWDVVMDTSGAPHLVYTKTSGYFPLRGSTGYSTHLGTLRSGTLVEESVLSGLPTITTGFRAPTVSSSNGYNYPLLVRQNAVVTQ